MIVAALAVFPLLRLAPLAFAPPTSDTDGRSFLEVLGYSAPALLVLAALCTIIAAFAGYALSRRDHHRFGGAGGLVLLAAILLLLPPYIGVERLGQTSPLVAMLSIYGVVALPFCTWIMKTAADAIRPGLLEAARLDGCSSWECVRLVILPLLARALVATALFAFVTAWDLNFLYLNPISPARFSAGLLLSVPLVLLFAIVGSRPTATEPATAA